MDLNTIIMHLDNFVDTWKGWGQVFDGLFAVSSRDTGDDVVSFVEAWDTAEKFSSLSSASSDNQ